MEGAGRHRRSRTTPPRLRVLKKAAVSGVTPGVTLAQNLHHRCPSREGHLLQAEPLVQAVMTDDGPGERQIPDGRLTPSHTPPNTRQPGTGNVPPSQSRSRSSASQPAATPRTAGPGDSPPPRPPQPLVRGRPAPSPNPTRRQPRRSFPGPEKHLPALISLKDLQEPGATGAHQGAAGDSDGAGGWGSPGGTRLDPPAKWSNGNRAAL